MKFTDLPESIQKAHEGDNPQNIVSVCATDTDEGVTFTVVTTRTIFTWKHVGQGIHSRWEAKTQLRKPR